MAFTVYPTPATAPLLLAAGASGGQSFSEPSGLNANDTMYILVAMSSVACPTTTGTQPNVYLQAGTGDEQLVLLNGVETSIYNVPGATPPPSAFVASATMFTTEPNDIFRIEVDVFQTGSTWNIRIENLDAAQRDFTWVIANSDSEARQPWLHAPDLLDFAPLGHVLTTQTVQMALTAANKGTGPLVVDAANVGQPAGSDFAITAVPGAINPNDCGDLTVEFHAPATPGVSDVPAYTILSDDPTLTTGPGHNRDVHLQATRGQLEVVMVLDASGSMAFTPDGTDSFPGIAESDTRWGQMRIAAEQFLDLLEDFSGGLGRVGIVVFPDITVPGYPPVPDSATSVVLFPSADIPSDVTPIKNLLNIMPQAGNGWTPLGSGIGAAMGTVAGSFAQFQGGGGNQAAVDHNERWMLVLSDGKENLGPPASDFYGPSTDPTSFRGKKIKVFSAAYGDPGAVNWPPDQLQMQNLRTNSDGIYADAGPNDLGVTAAGDLGLTVFKSFRQAITQGLALDPSSDPGGLLTSGAPEVRRLVDILPYDNQVSFIVDWLSFNAERVSVQLLTPLCELITPTDAQSRPDVTYHNSARYAIYTVNQSFLRNDDEPAKPRYGTWTLIITGHDLAQGQSETYQYEIITRSRLRMDVEFGRANYFAGDAIQLSARLTLDGKPIRNAHVTMRVAAPGQSLVNWLAQAKVSPVEIRKATQLLPGDDVTPLTIKARATQLRGLKFQPFSNISTLPMSETSEPGVYSATFDGTTVQGSYFFQVTAVGQTEDGISFRREQQLATLVSVRPLIDFTTIDIRYAQVLDSQRPFLQAEITVLPADQYGNVLLLDSTDEQVLSLTAEDGQFTGPLQSNLDGTYTRTLRYGRDNKPAITLQAGGRPLVSSQELTPVTDLIFANTIVEYRPGVSRADGGNQYDNPKAALGDVLAGKEPAFVALGVGGVLAVGVSGRVIKARRGGSKQDGDVTVFVSSPPPPDDARRPYRVDALPLDDEQWVTLGKSAGNTASFSLQSAGLEAAQAVRIVDISGHLRDALGKPSVAPGATISGVGFRSVGERPKPQGFPLTCLEDLDKRSAAMLRDAGINTIPELAAADPDRLHVDIARLMLLELISQARIAEKAVRQLTGMRSVLSIDLTIGEILTADDAWVRERTGLDPRTLALLREQLMSLVVIMQNDCLEKRTLRDLLAGWR